MNSSFTLSWVARNSASLLLTSSILLALGLGESILTARLLGPYGKGVVFIVVLTASTVAQLVGCSIGHSLQYHIGRRVLSEIVALRLVILYVLVVGGITILLLELLEDFATTVFSIDAAYAKLAFLALALIPVEMLNQNLFPLFIAADMVKYRNLIVTGGGLLELVLIMFLVGYSGGGYVGALEAVVVSNGMAALLLVAVFSKRYGSAPSGVWRNALWPVLKFGLQHHGATIMSRAMRRADTYLLAYFLGSAYVGIYSVAISLAELPLLVAKSLHGLILSFVTTSGKEYASRATARLSRLALAPLFLACTVYGIVLIWGLPLAFGSSFSVAYWPSLILLIATFCLSFYFIGGGYLYGSGNPKLVAYVMSFSVLCNLALSLILIPSLGLIGNAVATASASVLTFMIVLYYFGKISGRNYREILLPNISDRIYMRQLLRQFWGGIRREAVQGVK